MKFLESAFILNTHSKLIDLFGGTDGIRDHGLLDSALAQPSATFGGELLHPTVWEAAAAYGFHLVKNHPFLDGNKRTAGVAMGVFLGLNGFRMTATEGEFYVLVAALAAGECSKDQLTTWLRANTTER